MSAAQAQELLLETIRYTREQAADGVQLLAWASWVWRTPPLLRRLSAC
jgi:hypothetical protein